MLPERTMTAPPSRAGGRLLSLFASPLNVLVLRAHADLPMRLLGLHKCLGASQSTLREYLANLIELGALSRRDLERTPRAVATELTDLGRELLCVADVIDDWLACAPGGQITLCSGQGKAAVKALAAGWDSRVLGFLAASPHSLTELDGLIEDISYPALERRLAAMRARDLIEVVPTDRPGTLYAVTDWARQAVAPLAAATRCEHRHLREDSEPITNVEFEAALLLALPLVTLPQRSHGTCLLVVDLGDPSDPSDNRQSVVRVEVERGKIRSISLPGPEESTSLPRIQASPLPWFEAVIDGRPQGLYGNDDSGLPVGLAEGLRDTLFPTQTGAAG